ncbi:MAG: hypothetical protein KGH94_00010 [Candidatus Micrarchaeota archaeon]|nr:hypothetical protein [Candidatus Micrarchaeota archaeon]
MYGRIVIGGLLTMATLAFLLGAVMELGSVVSFAGTTSNTVSGTVGVQKVCAISTVSATAINFGSIFPGGNVNTANALTITDSGGNAASNILVEGGLGNLLGSNNDIWVGTSASNTIYISNTLWSAASQGSYTGTALTNALVDTAVVLPAPTQASPSKSNTIYFGMGVPSGTPADTYTTNIIVETTC